MSDRSFEWTLTVADSDGGESERGGTSGSTASLASDIRQAVQDVVEDIDSADLDAELAGVAAADVAPESNVTDTASPDAPEAPAAEE